MVPRRVDVVIVGGSNAMKNWDSVVVTCYMTLSAPVTLATFAHGGTLMHWKELNREATPRRHPLRAGKRGASPVTRVRAAMTTLPRPIHAAGIPRRVASQD